jgi:uncharacterized protein YybS (DUF2232 family)
MPNIVPLLVQLVILILLFGVLDMLMLFMIRKNNRWIAIITAGMVYLAVIFLGMYIVNKKYAGVDTVDAMASDLRANMDSTLKAAKEQGATDDQLNMLKTQFENLVIRMLPAWWFMIALFLVFLNYMVTRLFAVKKYGIRNDMPPFELWYLSEPVVWGLIASLAIFAFNRFISADWVLTVGINSAFVLGNLYFMVGLGVASFLFKKYKLPFILQTLIIILIVFWVYLSIIIMLAGVLDTWFNFRKIEKGGSIWR